MSVETCWTDKQRQLVMRFKKLLSSMRDAQPAYNRPHHSARAYFFQIGTLFLPISSFTHLILLPSHSYPSHLTHLFGTFIPSIFLKCDVLITCLSCLLLIPRRPCCIWLLLLIALGTLHHPTLVRRPILCALHYFGLTRHGKADIYETLLRPFALKILLASLLWEKDEENAAEDCV